MAKVHHQFWVISGVRQSSLLRTFLAFQNRYRRLASQCGYHIRKNFWFLIQRRFIALAGILPEGLVQNPEASL